MYSVCIQVHTLLNVYSYYDLSVLSMSVMGFQKNVDGEWVGGVLFWIFWTFFNSAKPLKICVFLSQIK